MNNLSGPSCRTCIHFEPYATGCGGHCGALGFGISEKVLDLGSCFHYRPRPAGVGRYDVSCLFCDLPLAAGRECESPGCIASKDYDPANPVEPDCQARQDLPGTAATKVANGEAPDLGDAGAKPSPSAACFACAHFKPLPGVTGLAVFVDGRCVGSCGRVS